VLFNSVAFFVFFAVVLAIYVPAPTRGRNIVLLLASYVFYGAWDWRFLGLLALSTLIDYRCAQAIEDSEPGRRRRWLMLSVLSNLGILAAFKYCNFFVASFAELCAALGAPVATTTLDIVLPVGISFYTFQTMGYTIDVYRGRMPAARDLAVFALYVAYFPQLVAGPIERATHLLPQIAGDRTITYARVRDGAWLILIGLFKKVVVADNMARIVDPVFGGDGSHSGAAALLAVYAFALQIYADFSGYTDIARGASKWLGIELMLNFRRPYFATNPREFWQRWHISLSQWLRNRGGPWQSYRNLMLTMLLGGLWHGASWMYVIWGAIHGALLVLHRMWLHLVGERGLPGLVHFLPPWIRGLLFFHIVCLAWIFFRSRTLAGAGHMLTALGSDLSFAPADWDTVRFMIVCAGPLLTLDLWEELHERRHGAPTTDALPFVFTAPPALRGLVYALLLLYIAVVGAPAGVEFIYFQF
jgi:D-alanyl-lipoteichoic acid acyltransferase DltB (MBOAT superfamily)